MSTPQCRVLILEGKHATIYYDVSDYDKFSAACMEVLDSRLHNGYYYRPGDPPVYDDTTLAKKGGETIIQFLERIDRTNKVNAKQYAAENKWYDDVEQLVNKGDKPVEIGPTNKRKIVPQSWLYLLDRRDHEYEYVEIIEPVDATVGK